MSTPAPGTVFSPAPVVLEGTAVRLEPLAPKHAEALWQAAADPAIWRYLPVPQPQTVEAMRTLIAAAWKGKFQDVSIPFAIVARDTGLAVGSTRYLNIERENRALEIGWSWLGRPHQRTAVNTECKYLLLRHAFEKLGALRVQLKTDARNLQSQRAIERIGAVREGTLRNHMILWDGHRRDSVYFSIVDSEWPRVKAHLETMLSA